MRTDATRAGSDGDVERSAAREALRGLVAAAHPDTVAAQEDGDGEASLEMVAYTDLLAQVAAAMRDEAVAAARHQKVSWARIGARLGMTKQAAQQRFGTPATAPDGDLTAVDLARAGVGETWRLTPVTAFNEMEWLAFYGRQGWHSVAYGPLFHDLVKDSVQWEHLRVNMLVNRRSRMEAEGWQVVGSGWFPWAYFARPTHRPAESD